MEFKQPLVKGRLLKRYKRFLADVELEDGSQITAHCPNTGGMIHCADPDMEVWLRFDPNPKRKLAYTWELAVNKHGDWIGINTHNANKLVEECLLTTDIIARINPQQLKREFTLLNRGSRLDFAILDEHKRPAHVYEVKSVTLKQNGQGYFPDAVTQRGAKHCRELAELCQQGMPSTLVFCVQHTGIHSVEIARHIDPEYAKAVQAAVQAGVEVIACACQITNEKITINQQLPVIL